MGQKTHPIGFRLGIVKNWSSRWFATKEFPKLLKEDILIRKYIRERHRRAAVSKIEIERKSRKVTVGIHTARPAIVIGKRGAEIERLKGELKHITEKDVELNIFEVKNPELDAALVADAVARQLEARVSYRRAMKRAVASAMRVGAQGIKLACKGRLAGAEIARAAWYKEGRIPLHTIRADIDYATATATTTYGCIGIKVWIYNGEIMRGREEEI
jgi:small subunit ribosomal protein S3